MSFLSWLDSCWCGGEWTKWEKNEHKFETINISNPEIKGIRFERYQERLCKKCGKVQQEGLTF